MKEYTVLSWNDSPMDRSTPLVVIGEMLRSQTLEKGMEIIKLTEGKKYRLVDFVFDDEHCERNGHYTLTMCLINKDGTDGKLVKGANVNMYLAVKKADIKDEHQRLFFHHQKVKGDIKDGVLVPAEEYLVNWHDMFLNYFDILRSNMHRDSTSVERGMPWLVRRCIDKIGTAEFNDFIRHHFSQWKNEDEFLNEIDSSLDHGCLYENEEDAGSFASVILHDIMRMGPWFGDAVKAVVFEHGMKIDFTRTRY